MCEHGSGDSNSSLVFTSLDILGQYVLELRSPNTLNRFWSSISGQRVNKKKTKIILVPWKCSGPPGGERCIYHSLPPGGDQNATV